jgi:hypothetical protein
MSAHTSASGSPAAFWRLSPAATLLAVLAAVTTVRLVAGALTPLSEDEAYYRLWSMRPALGYFDHPPMIAWWIWLGRQLAGDTALGVRLIPALGTAATTLVAFDLARRLGLSERVAARAGIWLNATLLVGVGGGLAVPDVPNALFWTVTLWCAFRAVNGAGAWWLAAGAAAGLACLSKYSALFLAPGILLWLVLARDARRQLLTPWPWIAILVAGLVFAPNVAWNAEHGWQTFAKQFGRVRAERLDPGFLLKLVVDQWLLLNPLIAAFIGLAVQRRVVWPVLAISAPFAGYLLLHSLHGEVQGQWPAPLYPLLAIAAAAAAEQASGRWAKLRALAAPMGFGLSAAALVWVVSPVDAALPFRDPLAPLRDWPPFSASVERARVAAGAGWVGAPTYGVAAQLAASHALAVPTVQVYERVRYSFEDPGRRADFAQPGLLVVAPRTPDKALMRRCFARADVLAPIVRGAGRSAMRYEVYRVAGPRVDVERWGCDALPGADLARTPPQ